jgi:hypothetical protein
MTSAPIWKMIWKNGVSESFASPFELINIHFCRAWRGFGRREYPPTIRMEI